MNIYQIKQDFLNIFDELEENGGELTDELEEKLKITQDEFKEKVRAYAAAVNLLNQDIEAIKAEKKRLTDFAAKKQKAINQLSSILIDAIEEFGDTKRSGVKYIDYGTGEISIRRSVAVEVDNEVLKDIERGIDCYFGDAKLNRQLDVNDKLSSDDIVAYIKSLKGIHDDITIDDIINTNINLIVTIPISDLIDGKGYNTIRETVKYTNRYKIEGDISKSDIKPKLQADGSCAPHLAKLVENKSIQIK